MPLIKNSLFKFQNPSVSFWIGFSISRLKTRESFKHLSDKSSKLRRSRMFCPARSWRRSPIGRGSPSRTLASVHDWAWLERLKPRSRTTRSQRQPPSRSNVIFYSQLLFMWRTDFKFNSSQLFISLWQKCESQREVEFLYLNLVSQLKNRPFVITLKYFFQLQNSLFLSKKAWSR